MDPAAIANAVKLRAERLGFARCGVCSAVAPPGASRLDEWLALGYAGDMLYLEERREAYRHPRHVLEGVRSLIMLTLPYGGATPAPTPPGTGRVARYAWGGADYHDLARERLHALADYLRALSPTSKTRGVVDTAPLLEREFAQLAGLGWVGKNTLLLNQSAGSYFFLAALLTDLALPPDAAHQQDHCGTCTACLDACPTDAFPAPYVLNASRCISYLTIEHRDATPTELREPIGDWVFGCDVCQEVCPWNRRSDPVATPELLPTKSLDPLHLSGLFDLDEAGFRREFRHTPLWRAHRRGLLRNAAIVLGNAGDAAAVAPLVKGLQDEEPLVRAACVWALSRIDAESARDSLRERASRETDPDVLREFAAASTSG